MKSSRFKMKYLKPFLIIAFLVTVTTVYAVQSREIESRLNAGKVKISTEGEFDIVQMDGPIDFSHSGHSIKGNSAKLKLINDDSTEEWTPYELEIFGNINYGDNAGYKATCKSALFNFTSETAILSGSVSLSGNNITLDAAKATYNKQDEKLQADGNVHFESQTKYIPNSSDTGHNIALNAAQVTYEKKNEKLTAKGAVHFESKTKYIPLSPDTGSHNELITYNLDCESLIHNNKLRNVSATSKVTFKIGETGILCQKADITFDDNEITGVICEGNVEFYDPYMTGSADIIKYDKSSLTLVLLSNSQKNVLVSYKGQDVKGKQVTVTLGDEREIVLDKGTISVKSNK